MKAGFGEVNKEIFIICTIVLQRSVIND
jgi:hypothetical protein